MDALRIQPLGYKPSHFSYRSVRIGPNVVRILGAPTFLHYILLRRAKLTPLLVSPAIRLECEKQSCNPLAPNPFASTSPSDISQLDLDWPHAIEANEVTVYVSESQQPVDSPQTGSVIDLLF